MDLPLYSYGEAPIPAENPSEDCAPSGLIPDPADWIVMTGRSRSWFTRRGLWFAHIGRGPARPVGVDAVEVHYAWTGWGRTRQGAIANALNVAAASDRDAAAWIASGRRTVLRLDNPDPTRRP